MNNRFVLHYLFLFSTLFLGASNTIGRFVGGPIAMIPGLNALRVHNALLFVAGALTVLAAYANSFLAAALYATLCGFAIGKYFRFFSINFDRFFSFSTSYVVTSKCYLRLCWS